MHIPAEEVVLFPLVVFPCLSPSTGPLFVMPLLTVCVAELCSHEIVCYHPLHSTGTIFIIQFEFWLFNRNIIVNKS